MSNFLKQSTAVVVSFGPFLDKTDGVTEETGLVSSLDHATTGIKLSKNGGALTIRHATVTATTYDAYGAYRVTLDTTDTNTLGTLRMAFNEAATCLPVWQDFMILPANVYDSIVSGSDLIDVSMTQILGTAVSSPATAGILDVNLKNIANAAVSTSTAQLGVNVVNAGATAWGSGAITAASIATGAITNAKFAAGAIDAAAIANAAIDNATFAADVGSTAYATNVIALAANKAVQNAALATATNLAAAKTVVDAIKVKTDYLPSATAGAAGGVFIAGANAATSITTALTANITGNLSGSVGSVTGSVGSVAANGITATSIATDAINAASVKADAVTKIQTGLATPTNITAADVNVTKILGTAVSTPATAGILDVNVKNIGNGAVDMFSTGVPLVGLTGGDIGGLSFLAGATVGAVSGLTASNLDATISSRLASASYTAPPSAAANASQVRTELTTELARIDVATSTRLASASYTAPLDAAGTRTAVGLASANLDTQLAAELAQATLARKILKNRTETNPATGVMTIYDDDGTTPLYTANLYTDVAGATLYAGTAAVNRRDALA